LTVWTKKNHKKPGLQ